MVALDGYHAHKLTLLSERRGQRKHLQTDSRANAHTHTHTKQTYTSTYTHKQKYNTERRKLDEFFTLPATWVSVFHIARNYVSANR